MKVKIINDYYDKSLKKMMRSGDEIVVNNERGDVLIKAKVGQLINEPTTTKKKSGGAKSNEVHTD